MPADRGRRGEGRGHARRRPRDALHAVHARRQADRRLRPARRHHERPAPGAGRLLAPGPLLRPRQLAAQRPGDLHADGQVLPRPGLAAVHPGPGPAAGLELRQPDPLHRREPPARRRGPVRGLLGRSGLPLFGAAALPRPARPGRARLAAERRHRRLLSRRPGRGAGHRPVRPVRLRLRQRRRRPPGRRAGVSRRDHGHLHHDRVHPGRPPADPGVRHPRRARPATARPSASTTSSPAPSGRSPRRPRAG